MTTPSTSQEQMVAQSTKDFKQKQRATGEKLRDDVQTLLTDLKEGLSPEDRLKRQSEIMDKVFLRIINDCEGFLNYKDYQSTYFNTDTLKVALRAQGQFFGIFRTLALLKRLDGTTTPKK